MPTNVWEEKKDVSFNQSTNCDYWSPVKTIISIICKVFYVIISLFLLKIIDFKFNLEFDRLRVSF